MTLSSISAAEARSGHGTVRSRDGLAPHQASLTLAPGHVLAVTGVSGSGKTTAVHVLLGLIQPDQGCAAVVAADGTRHDLHEIDLRTLWSQIALLPQRPVLPPGTLRDVLRSARPDANDDDLSAVAAATGLDRVIADRGWDAQLGRSGSGLSLGERQRLALSRALLSPAQLVVLDEPTAHLDGSTEQLVLDLITRLAAEGRTVIVIAHRSRLVDLADDTVEIHAEVTT